jgi:hypothetical protein
MERAEMKNQFSEWIRNTGKVTTKGTSKIENTLATGLLYDI